ncbi:MAG: acyl carrier protein [Allosphingosinicella sp.]
MADTKEHELTTQARVAKIISDHLGVPFADVKAESTLADDLEADSLDVIELEMALEEEFGFCFPDDATLDKRHTVAEVTALVDQYRPA